MSLASQNVDFNGQTIRFTASMGLVCMTPDELEIEHGVQSALARADRELYRAKRRGATGLRGELAGGCFPGVQARRALALSST
jgi:GGDEF domain-containing protein